MKQKIEVTVLPQNFTPDEQKQARQNIGIDLANLVTSADNSLSGKLVLEDNEWVSLPDEHKYILTSTNETINITKTDNDNVTLWDVSVNSGGYKIVELDPITKEPLVENPSPLYIYLTKIEDTVGDDKYKEWVWDVNKSIWVLIGDTTIDLSDYYTIEETDKIMKAQMARGADFESGNIFKKAKSLIPLLVPLFISAFRRANDLAMAMEARCYHGDEGRTKMKPLHYNRRDYIAYVVIWLFLIVCIVFGRNAWWLV